MRPSEPRKEDLTSPEMPAQSRGAKTPAPTHPCTNCGYPMFEHENCPVCLAVDNMRLLWQRRRHQANFIARSQPFELE